MNHKKIIVVVIILLGILALFMLIDYKNKNGLGGQTLSPNILYITQPVTSFSGKVEKIEGNTILVSNQYTIPQTAPISIKVITNQPSDIPTPQIKTITYKLLVTDKTQISQPASNINYLFKTITPSGAPGFPTASTPNLTVKNIKVGQYITVNSQDDLRTLLKNTFEATMINLPPIINTLNGKIVNITNNTLTLKAFAPVAAAPPMIALDTAPPTPQEKEYTIYITQDTEISRNVYGTNMTPGEPPTPPKPEKLTLADLKADMRATVYTVEDVIETQTLTALRIEPVASTSPLIKP